MVRSRVSVRSSTSPFLSAKPSHRPTENSGAASVPTVRDAASSRRRRQPDASKTDVGDATRAPAAIRALAAGGGACYPSPMQALVLPLAEVAAHLPARGALIGIDLGSKTIGVASSDPDRRLATGVETIARKNFTSDAARLLALAGERKAAAFVLGLPVNMDGSEGPRAQSTRAFARNLARLTELPIALWDERLSTAAVERELIAADVTRARRAAVIDQHAAAFILQGALDRLARA